jgi:hypothetical protein
MDEFSRDQRLARAEKSNQSSRKAAKKLTQKDPIELFN